MSFERRAAAAAAAPLLLLLYERTHPRQTEAEAPTTDREPVEQQRKQPVSWGTSVATAHRFPERSFPPGNQ